MGADFRRDPSSALLEVLDPSRTRTFNTDSLEVDTDSFQPREFITTSDKLCNIFRSL